MGILRWAGPQEGAIISHVFMGQAELDPSIFTSTAIWDAKMEHRIIPFLGEGSMTLLGK